MALDISEEYTSVGKKFWQEAQLSQDDELQKVNANLHSFDLIDEQIYLAK